MPPYGEPDWATPGDTTNVTQQVTAPTASQMALPQYNSGGSKGSARATCFLALLSLLNMGLGALMGALGVLTLIHFGKGVDVVTIAFLGCYLIVFGALLFLYELLYWQPFPALNKSLRRNFGFLYGIKGKGFFLIFIAFLCLGLRDDKWSGQRALNWSTGLGWLGDGVFHVFVACTMPDIVEAYRPPTAGLVSEEINSGSISNV